MYIFKSLKQQNKISQLYITKKSSDTLFTTIVEAPNKKEVEKKGGMGRGKFVTLRGGGGGFDPLAIK